MFLLDTVVLSELRKADRDPGVNQWIAGQRGPDLYLSVLTVGEVRRGIRLQEHKDPTFAGRLSVWLDSVLQLYGTQILPVTTEIALAWGELSALSGNSSADLLLAATAKIHDLTVVTRNTKHFEGTGVPVFNPWAPKA